MTAVETLIKGGTVVAMDAAKSVVRADVRVVGGRIVEVGPDLRTKGAFVVEADGCAVLPGLIHAHLHLCQVLFRGMAEDRALLPWLAERIWPLEAAHDPVSLRASAELGIAELLLSGATTALDMGTVHHHDAVFEAARDLGVRLVSGKAMMDSGVGVPDGLRETTEASLAESDRLRTLWDGAADGRLRYAYAPRFVLSCSDELLRGVASRVAAGGRLHTHSSENPAEVEAVREATGRENVDLLDHLGLLGPRSVLAHGVHLSDTEVRRLAETGTSIAHCPSANLKLASGIADVPRLVAGGVNVGLGADGAPCNNNLDLWREMKLAGLLQRLRHGAAGFPAMRILELATLGGARALGLADEIGSLEAGKRADVIVVDLRGPHLTPVTDVATALVYSAMPADVRSVLVDGRLLVHRSKLVEADAAKIVAAARVQAGLVAARAGIPVHVH